MTTIPLPRPNDNLASSRVTDASLVINKIDQIIFDCFLTSTDVVLKGRNAHILPIKKNNSSSSSSSNVIHITEFISNSDFCAQALSFWRPDISVPLYIDLSLVLSKSRKMLIERWRFTYQRRNESKPVKTKMFQKRIITFTRTLYSFVRLLPGFQVLKLLPQAPNLLFEISDSEDPPITTQNEAWKVYDFPGMATPLGVLEVGVCYVETSVLQVTSRRNLPIHLIIK